jgi:hypothetical protein
MRWPSIKSLYNELTKDSLENAVDALWNNILQLYFRVEYNYAIVAQANPDSRSKQKADFAVRYVHNGVPRKVVLIEYKRVSDESSNTAWAAAMAQLVDYMEQARAANPPPEKDMYGIVTVGHYSRFYTLSSDVDTLSDFSSSYMDYTGQPLHFKHDEYWMHTLLEELVQLTCH